MLGESGNGKSALEKTYVLRQLRFRDRQVVVLDAQGEDGVGEWNLIAEALGITPIRLDPMAALDGGIKLNPLDPAITATGQLALLRTIIEVAMGRGLDERSGFALKVAHAHVIETDHRAPADPDRHRGHACATPTPESAEAMNVDLDDVRAWGLDVALVLDRLVDGDLRGMFDGPTTAGIDLDAPLIVFDLSHIDRNSIAMPILMAIVGVWLEHTWIRPDRKKRIFLVEEAWHIINIALRGPAVPAAAEVRPPARPVASSPSCTTCPTWSTAPRPRRPRRSSRWPPPAPSTRRRPTRHGPPDGCSACRAGPWRSSRP